MPIRHDATDRANGAVTAAVDAALPRTLPMDPLNAQYFEAVQAEIVRLQGLRGEQFNRYLAAAGLLPLREGMRWELQKIDDRLHVVECPAPKEDT